MSFTSICGTSRKCLSAVNRVPPTLMQQALIQMSFVGICLPLLRREA